MTIDTICVTLEMNQSIFLKEIFGRGSLMVWRTISLIVCLEPQFPSKLMNSTELLWWPAWSLDMNIVEKIWGILM